MNWLKALIAGVVAGVVMNLVDFVTHGIIMADTYRRYADVFTQEQSSPAWFFLVAICVAVAAALLYARTYDCWSGGLKGGLAFGFWLGLVLFFVPFYSALVIDGWPYFLSWCHGGMNLIGFLVAGAVIGLVYKP